MEVERDDGVCWIKFFREYALPSCRFLLLQNKITIKNVMDICKPWLAFLRMWDVCGMLTFLFFRWIILFLPLTSSPKLMFQVHGGCGYFRWFDPASNARDKDIINQLLQRNKKLEFKISSYKRRTKWAFYFVLACWILMALYFKAFEF